MLLGLVVAWLVVEAYARLTGLGETPQLGTDFDRSPVLYAPEPPRRHPWTEPGETPFVVAVIGDSFTVGEGVQVDDSYPYRLERLLNLNADTQPAEVRVWAQSGTSTHTQLRFLRRAVAEGPDLMILGIFVNDSETHKIAAWREPLRPRVASGWKLGLITASRSAAWLYQRYEEERIRRAWIDYMRKIWDPEFEGRKAFERAVGKFAARTRERAIPLLAVVLPPAGALGAGYPLTFVHDAIRETLEENDVPYFDLLPVFRGRSGERLAVLPGVGGRLNGIGGRIVAEAIFGHLLRAGWIPSEYEPRLATEQRRDYWRNKLLAAKSVRPR